MGGSASGMWLPALCIAYALPFLLWRIGRTDHWAPLVVVQIAVGLALGPGLLGKVEPGWYAALFPVPTLDALGTIAMLAVILFVWTAGIELDLADLRTHAREAGIAAGYAIAGPLLAGTAAAVALLQLPGWAGPRAEPWQTALGMGMSCSVTALPILVLILERLSMLRTPLGRRVLRIASLDDILLWGVLALILLDPARLGGQAAFLAGFAVSAAVVRRVMPRLRSGDRWPAALIWLAACAWAADRAEFHYMVGAFLAGLVLDREWLGDARVDAFRDMVLAALMPVFFVNTGIRTDWTSGGVAILAAALLLLLATVGGKLAGVGIAARLLRWNRDEAIVIGLLLQTKALVMIIFSRILLDRGIISAAGFSALLVMAIASTALTIPALRLHRRRGPSIPAERTTRC